MIFSKIFFYKYTYIMFQKNIMEPGMIIHHKIGWNELLKYNSNPPQISFPKGIIIYNKYKYHISKIKNIYEYLINYLFFNNCFFVIKNADFPYYVSEYIQHKILWFNPSFFNNIKINYQFFYKILNIKYKYFIVFENIFNNRSIKNIKHFHFFILSVNKYNVII